MKTEAELLAQVQFELIQSLSKENEALKKQLAHLESILFSRAILLPTLEEN